MEQHARLVPAVHHDLRDLLDGVREAEKVIVLRNVITLMRMNNVQILCRNQCVRIESEYPRQRYQIDMVELHQSLGPKYILTLVDHFSKFGYVWKMGSKAAGGVIEKLKEFFKEHGKPEILQSDNGREFVN